MSGVRTALAETNQTGSFQRVDSGWRNWVEEGGRFAPEEGRYHLYVALACPWAARSLATLYLKGLDHAIGVSVVHPTWQFTAPDKDQHTGWVFRNPEDPPLANTEGHGEISCDGCIPDTVHNTKTLRELYELAGDTFGKYSTPVLFDKKENTIVNNESADIMEMFNSRFNSISKKPELNLYPDELRTQIEEYNTWIYPGVNNGVYRCGFAKKQEPYEEAFKELFGALDRLEGILSTQRYLCGDRFTAADLRLFVTLIRFDAVYVVYFKTNKKFIHQYPNLFAYTRDIYQMPEIKKSVNFDHIKRHYFTAHPTLNFYAIIPQGPDLNWDEPAGRENVGKQ